MRGRSKPLSDYVGASNVFVYGFRRYVVVIFLVISHTMLSTQSYKEYLRWQSIML